MIVAATTPVTLTEALKKLERFNKKISEKKGSIGKEEAKKEIAELKKILDGCKSDMKKALKGKISAQHARTNLKLIKAIAFLQTYKEIQEQVGKIITALFSRSLSELLHVAGDIDRTSKEQKYRISSVQGDKLDAR